MLAVRRSVRSSLAGIACLLLLAPAASAACADADALVPAGSARGAGLPVQLMATVCLVNEERASRGLGVLTVDPELVAAAYAHAADMTARRYFAHTGADGSSVLDRIVRSGYPDDPETWLAGENLGYGTATLATPRAIVDAWLDSPAHRNVMLEPAYGEIGVMVLAGVPASDAAGGATYVAELGTRTGGAAPAVPVAKSRKRSRRCRAKSAAARRPGATSAARRAARRCR